MCLTVSVRLALHINFSQIVCSSCLLVRNSWVQRAMCVFTIIVFVNHLVPTGISQSVCCMTLTEVRISSCYFHLWKDCTTFYQQMFAWDLIELLICNDLLSNHKLFWQDAWFVVMVPSTHSKFWFLLNHFWENYSCRASSWFFKPGLRVLLFQIFFPLSELWNRNSTGQGVIRQEVQVKLKQD